VSLVAVDALSEIFNIWGLICTHISDRLRWITRRGGIGQSRGVVNLISDIACEIRD
jgi:hypothetical protein